LTILINTRSIYSDGTGYYVYLLTNVYFVNENRRDGNNIGCILTRMGAGGAHSICHFVIMVLLMKPEARVLTDTLQ